MSYTQEGQKTGIWKKVLWADENKIALHQKDERRQTGRRRAHDLKDTTLSVRDGEGSVMTWTCMAVELGH